MNWGGRMDPRGPGLAGGAPMARPAPATGLAPGANPASRPAAATQAPVASPAVRPTAPMASPVRAIGTQVGMRSAFDVGGVTETTTTDGGLPHHAGPIHSSVAGRTDHLPMNVASGSYVLPADSVAHSGQDSTVAGFKVLKRVFSGLPRSAGATPYGGSGGPYNSGSHPYNQASPLPYGATMARGGASDGVPIVAAGGEFVITPDQVRAVGDGDLDRGHRVLDKFVLEIRKDHIKTLKGLAKPRKD